MAKENLTTRRGFLKKSAAAATVAVVSRNAAFNPSTKQSAALNDSRILVRRPATISMASFPTLPANESDRLTKTLKRMEDCIDQAAELNSDLVAFPETCNYLNAADPWIFEPLDGPTLTAMSHKASQHQIYVVCPLYTIETGKRYNSSVLIGRDGQIVGIYHKNFTTHGELDNGVIPGTETPVFDTDIGRIGLSICFDLNYWEMGSGLCANKAELVIWSSMWEGDRMLTRWAIEFGFYIAAIYENRSSLVDVAGREIINHRRNVYNKTAGAATPLVTSTIDMDIRLLHHDQNRDRLAPLYEKYGATSLNAEWLGNECIMVLGSRMPGISTDELISEFNMVTMRDFLALVREDRKKALAGTYVSRK